MELFKFEIDCDPKILNCLFNGGINLSTKLDSNKLFIIGTSNISPINIKMESDLVNSEHTQFGSIKSESANSESIPEQKDPINNHVNNPVNDSFYGPSTNSSEDCSGKYVYVLKLQNSKYYVGYTENLEQKLRQDFYGDYSLFYEIFKCEPKCKPLAILKRLNFSNKHTQLLVTLELTKKYGRENVRGDPCINSFIQENYPNDDTINSIDIIYCKDI